LNPAFIIGPTLLNSTFVALQLVGGFLLGKTPAAPPVRMAIIDVRDVAEAHY